MALADIEARVNRDTAPVRVCSVCYHMDERGTEWADTLRRLLSSPGVRITELARALTDDPDEPTIPRSSLMRHARGDCPAGERLR